MKLKYTGPIDEVTLPALGDLTVKRNHTLEVPEFATPDQVKALLESDVWEAADPTSKRIAGEIDKARSEAAAAAEPAPESEEAEAE